MDEHNAPGGWAHSIGPFMDDALVLVGAVLIGVGVWRYWPGCIWFYAGACCLAAGFLAGLPARRPRGV